MTYLVNLDNVGGLAELAARYDVPYSTVLSWSRTRSFPTPCKTMKMGPMWDFNATDRWKQQNRSKA